MSLSEAESVTINVEGKDYDAVVDVDHTPRQASTHDDAQIDECYWFQNLCRKKNNEWEPVEDLLKFKSVRESILAQLMAGS